MRRVVLIGAGISRVMGSAQYPLMQNFSSHSRY